MSFSVRMVPDNKEVLRQIALAPNEEPVVEMNDKTARDINVIWNSIQDAATRWRGNRDSYFPGMPADRKEFWGAFAKDHKTSSLPVVEEFIGNSEGKGKTAIDLGCGNSPAAKLLLQRGWSVIAVDNSRSALNVLAEQNKAAIRSGQLSIIEADISTYIPSQPVDLVIAADVFSYIDPSNFRNTWIKVHDVFIKKNGFLVGSLFRSAVNQKQVPLMNLLKEMGAWLLPDRRMVRPLLTEAGYEIKTCKYRKDDSELKLDEQMCIQFIAKKTSD